MSYLNTRELGFESSASEGAVLAMPSATFQSNLNDLDRFYQHIGTHAESWYRYANGPGMGRRLDNGDLCLVIGCDKTTSWGIATFSNSLDQTTSRLQFRPVESSSGDPGCSYVWEHSGTADSPRVGPDRAATSALGTQAEARSLQNQCLFVRFLSLKLSDSAWSGFREPSGVQIRMESHRPTFTANKTSNQPNLRSSRRFGAALTNAFRSTFGLFGDASNVAETCAVSVSVCLDFIPPAFFNAGPHIRKCNHCQNYLVITFFRFRAPKWQQLMVWNGT